MAVVDQLDQQIHIGPRVRALREAMALSLRDLAERSGVSAPMLSQVERGETSPTLAVAAHIPPALEPPRPPMSALGGGPRPPRGRPPAAAPRRPPGPGAAPGGRGAPPMHEPGSRETAVVLAGTLAL